MQVYWSAAVVELLPPGLVTRACTAPGRFPDGQTGVPAHHGYLVVASSRQHVIPRGRCPVPSEHAKGTTGRGGWADKGTAQ